MKKWIFSMLLAVLVLKSQESAADMQVRTSAWRRNTAVVLFSGIGGSILGLSTLSFYGDPKEHTGNIMAGALLGLMGGTAYLVYENTPHNERPRHYNDYYGLFEPEDAKIKKPTLASVPTMNFQFTF